MAVEPAQWAHGKWGKATFQSNDYNIQDWTWSASGTTDDVTHSGSGGVELDEVVTVKYTGSFTGKWDITAQPTSAPRYLDVGRTGTLALYVTRDQTISQAVVITGFTVESSTKTVVSYNVTFSGTAAPTYPGATAYSSSSSSSSST